MSKIIGARSCANCAYSIREQREMTCHFNPPAVMPIVSAGANGQPVVVAHVASWPPVNGEVWCGHWRTRIAAADGVDLSRAHIGGAA